jgi:hypothetical protein
MGDLKYKTKKAAFYSSLLSLIAKPEAFYGVMVSCNCFTTCDDLSWFKLVATKVIL